MLLTTSWTIDIFIFLTSVLFLLYKYVTRNFGYWEQRGVYHLKPIPFFGNAYDLATFNTHIGGWFRNLYETIKQPFFGLYMFDEPCLVIQSPELIKQILVKDFRHFIDRTVLSPDHNEVVSNMLFWKKGAEWKTLRAKMSPAFTVGKMKGMFSLIDNVGYDMTAYLKKNQGQVDAKDVCERYATDVISICAFSIKAYSFENEDAVFRKVGKSMFEFSWKSAVYKAGYFFFQKWANRFRFDFFEPWTEKFLKSVFWQAINIREGSTEKGADIIDIIVNMRKNTKLCSEINFEGDKVVAQAVQFFPAGFETTSAAIAFTLYELCIHPDIQNRLRKEIMDNIKENNGITYQGVLSIKYLDMCLKETLRRYPALAFLDRRCNADYKIPGTDVIIEKGISIYISLVGVHHDEKYFPKPHEYNPERFSDNNYYNSNGTYYMPFGEGPRICIGERMGMLSTKLGLVHILSEFIVEKSADTPVPLVFEPKSFILRSKVGLPIVFKQYVPQC